MQISRPGQTHSVAAASYALALVAVGTVAFGLYRLALWLNYKPVSGSSSPALMTDLLQAFWMGLRFDLKAMAYCALLLLLAGLAPRRWRSITLLSVCSLVLLLANFLAMINHFYFGFYGSTIDPMIFGVFEDDTAVIAQTVLREFPIFWILAFWLALTALQVWLVRWLARRLEPSLTQWPRAANIAVVLLLVLLGRGSFGSFALGSKHLSVVADPFVNQLVPNAIEATYLAVKLRNLTSISNDPYSGLRTYGFASPQKAAAASGLAAVENEDALLAQMYGRTPMNAQLAQRPPHVVFVMMESFGRHIMEYQSAQNDVLGRFARHASEDYLFRNFVSSQHGTHRTIEALLLNSPITPLTQGRFGYHTFAAAAALPYQRAGYRTIFLTSGPATWRNVSDVLTHQGFDAVYDVSQLRARYPDVKFGVRGAPDEYTFRYAAELLEEGERRGQPVFVFLFTTNNHPPHEVPEAYKALPLNIEAYGARAPQDRELGLRILKTYQYAADALGGFLDRLKASPLGEHTVVAAAGDHNTRQFITYTGFGELPLAYGVPVYFYLPPNQRADATFNSRRFGSLRDIFPTLYSHSLSGACYLKAGDDVFAPEPAGGSAGLALYDYVLAPEGAVANLKQPQFLRWADSSHLSLLPVTVTVPEELRQRAVQERAKVALLDWSTRMQALESRPAQPPCPSEPDK
jgi:phosphoglycerol transferase MdoB-like AlkP superfamily enzyme